MPSSVAPSAGRGTVPPGHQAGGQAGDEAGRAHPTGRPSPPWRLLTEERPAPGRADAMRTSRVLLQVGLVAAVVIALVAGGSVVFARRIAEREAVNAAAQATDLLAESVVQVSLEDSLLSADPAEARARLDAVVRKHVLTASGVMRVKLWTAQGEIVYSDEAQLIGRHFALGADEQGVLLHPRTEADVSDLSKPENEFDRGHGKLLEVYRPIWTPNGKAVLFETYTRYQTVTARTTQLWRGFAGLVVSSLLLLVVLLLPLLWTLLERLRRAQRLRESLLQDAVDASARERQRIAGTLHDGVVQELAGTSLVVNAAAEQSEALGRPQLTRQLRSAADAVRGSIGGLRSLLVDIYPPNLRSAGLSVALTDLAAVVRSRDIRLELHLPPAGEPSGLDADGERLVFRVAQETLRNAAAHSRATAVTVRLARRPGQLVLDVDDDGVGFDSSTLDSAGAPGHFGLRLLPDLVQHGGGRLKLATAPGAGTRWRLEVPLT